MPSDFERDRALMEGHRNAATESYFQARPVLDLRDIRRAYEAAYAKAWEDCSALASAPAAPDAHEVWVAAQLVPGEGIEDGVERIEALLGAAAAPAAETGISASASAKLDAWEAAGELKLRAWGAMRDQEREINALRAQIAAQDSHPQAQVVEPDAARLDWLLRHLPGDALRYCVGELSDTAAEAEFRAAIDAARSSKAHGGAA